MKTSNVLKTYESIVSGLEIIETDGFKFSYMPDRLGYLTRNGRAFDGLLPDLLLVEVVGHDN